MHPEVITYLQFLSRAANVEARINDIPVAIGRAGEAKSANIPIREYILPGKNTLSIEVRGASEDIKEANENMEALVRVADFGEGDWLELDEGRQLALLKPELDSEAELPATGTVNFKIDGGPVWGWSKAEVLELNAVRAKADQLLKDMVDEFSRKDASALLKRMEHSLMEDVSAYPMIPLEGRRTDFENMITRERPAWKPVAFDSDSTDYRLVANGQLLEARDKTGLPVVRTETESPLEPLADPNYVGLPVYLGRLNGQLAVLR